MSNSPLDTAKKDSFHLLKHLRTLRGTKIGDWPVVLNRKGHGIEGRVCAIKKSRQATQRARKQVRGQAQKGGAKPRPETIEAAGYIFVFTTVKRCRLSQSVDNWYKISCALRESPRKRATRMEEIEA